MNRAISISLSSLLCILLSAGAAAQGCGTTVYDAGGAAGSYPNNSNQTWTYCPPAGQYLTISFTSFATQSNFDQLSIHAGPTNASPQLGIFSGNALPPSFTNNVLGGCLTLWFTSNNSNNNAGWAANITCAPPPAGDCIYSLSLNDSFGDGWGTSYVGVSINGGPYQNYTVTGSSNSVNLGVYVGQTVTLNYNNSGTYQGDNSYTLSLGGAPVFSSGTPPASGVAYSATVDCETPPAPPEDCIGGTTICGNQSFSSNANGTGNVADLTLATSGCLLSTEQQGTWYTFSPSTSGTVAFGINPSNPANDYDFALWGPYPDGSNTSTICPPTTAPLR
nr:CUB domain-containing protein [Bacteroidota bacterium]